MLNCNVCIYLISTFKNSLPFSPSPKKLVTIDNFSDVVNFAKIPFFLASHGAIPILVFRALPFLLPPLFKATESCTSLKNNNIQIKHH